MSVYHLLPLDAIACQTVLSKLLGQALMNVDIDHLYSLDPELHKHLLSLKTYEGDVQDLGLDFTIAVSDLGENKIELLKPEGDEIPVTNENRIEYIHLVADFAAEARVALCQQTSIIRDPSTSVRVGMRSPCSSTTGFLSASACLISIWQ